jgi:hypothetical protein
MMGLNPVGEFHTLSQDPGGKAVSASLANGTPVSQA